MKAVINVVVTMLAINFLAVVGAAGWMWKSGHLDKERAQAVKELLFPPPPPPPVTEEAATRPSTRPGEGDLAMLRLDELLASQKGVRTAAEPFATGEVYMNHLDAEKGARIRAVYSDNYDRLVTLKNKYDPNNLFHLDRNIKPTL